MNVGSHREPDERWSTDPHNPNRPLPHDAETWTDYLDRATRDLGNILDRHPSGRVLVVGHTETLAAMYALLLGVRNLGSLKVDMKPCGLSVWRAVQEWSGAVYAKQRWALVDRR
ncbi:histidine phosphatase family protein [Planosporangium flavigriseum]|uniref:histidine phosphatase family protein n=1 Tax=Planosporangium flavigriseum TaxID=373681 RepID=UPI00143C26CC|nr:histidine phosphatase family protein [Planosporangium flavigriseum]